MSYNLKRYLTGGTGWEDSSVGTSTAGNRTIHGTGNPNYHHVHQHCLHHVQDSAAEESFYNGNPLRAKCIVQFKLYQIY